MVRLPFIECPICGSPFYTKPYAQARGRGCYCSASCSNIGFAPKRHKLLGPRPLCACGCGLPVGRHGRNWSRYLRNHHLPRLHQQCSGSGHYLWTGLRKVGDYIYVHAADHPHANSRGLVKRSWLTVEAIVGRPVKRGLEEVHHINHDTTDDRPENLQLMNKSDHGRLHAFEMHAQRRA